MSYETNAAYKCSNCTTMCRVEIGEHAGYLPDTCLFGQADIPANWVRVELEQSTEGDSMHVPVIHEKSEVEGKKWEYETVVCVGRLEINMVDSKTGEHIAHLIRIETDGRLSRVGCAENCLLDGDEYTTQGLQFDEYGAIAIKPS